MMHGKVVIVTGAGGGIGGAICQGFAAEGANVVLVYRSSHEQTEALAASLTSGDGQRHVIARASVDDSEDMRALASLVDSEYGRADVLVNNAGMTRFVAHDDLDGLDDDLIDEIFRVNWRGAFAGARAFKDLLVRSSTQANSSVIINISSIAGTTGQGSNVAYCASKAALDSMTRSLARALAPAIRVVSVAPGLVVGEYASKLDPEWYQAQVNATPLKRLATSQDVADTCIAAVTHMRFTTGDILHVNGGRPLS